MQLKPKHREQHKRNTNGLKNVPKAPIVQNDWYEDEPEDCPF